MNDDAEECGEEKNNGQPCTYDAKYPDGKCGHHTKHDTGAERREGRPSKLSYERQEKIAADLERGKSMNSAARKVGIDPATVYNWLDRGESEYQDGNTENEYAEFYERITRARGKGEDHYFQTVWEIAKEEGDHRFLASLMKQRYPDSWAEGEDGPGVDTEAGTVIQIPDSVAEEWERTPNR